MLESQYLPVRRYYLNPRPKLSRQLRLALTVVPFGAGAIPPQLRAVSCQSMDPWITFVDVAQLQRPPRIGDPSSSDYSDLTNPTGEFAAEGMEAACYPPADTELLVIVGFKLRHEGFLDKTTIPSYLMR